ncbi:hypothetical protein Tco_0312322 [Tanacetum coccineum]
MLFAKYYELGRIHLFLWIIDENVEAEVDDEAEMKKHMEIVPDDEVEIDAIPLANKSPIIVDCKIIKEGKMIYFQIIRDDGSSRSLRRIVEIKRLHDDLGVNTAKVRVTAAKHNLLLLVIISEKYAK